MIPGESVPVSLSSQIAHRSDAVDGVALRVLVVDDNEDGAEMLTQALGILGCRVVTSHDGPSALAALRDFEPDVGILDIGLPGMSGYELAAMIRRDPRRRTMRLFALTGYGRPADVDQARRAGFDAHFTKPLDLTRLKDALRTLSPSPSRSWGLGPPASSPLPPGA
jgi:CheY-like chemotaxis protein